MASRRRHVSTGWKETAHHRREPGAGREMAAGDRRGRGGCGPGGTGRGEPGGDGGRHPQTRSDGSQPDRGHRFARGLRTGSRCALAEHGTFDILINNVGGRRINVPLHEQTFDEWRQILDLNLTSTFLCLKHNGGAMLTRGTGAG